MVFLSVTLGIPFHDVRQWSAAEILLYQVYYRVAPFGEERADIRSAMSMCQTANMHRDSSKHPQPYELNDFMPFAEREEVEQKGKDTPGMREQFQALMRKKK